MRTISRRRTRRESIDSTISSSSTLVEPEFESAKVKFAPNNIVHEREVKTLSKKRSQVFTKISSSVAPVARRVSVPAKKVATKAHAKCNSIISGVHDHMHMPRPLPHVKRAYTMHISHPDSTFASSCTAVKKLARDSTKWHLPRKQATIWLWRTIARTFYVYIPTGFVLILFIPYLYSLDINF